MGAWVEEEEACLCLSPRVCVLVGVCERVGVCVCMTVWGLSGGVRRRWPFCARHEGCSEKTVAQASICSLGAAVGRVVSSPLRFATPRLSPLYPVCSLAADLPETPAFSPEEPDLGLDLTLAFAKASMDEPVRKVMHAPHSWLVQMPGQCPIAFSRSLLLGTLMNEIRLGTLDCRQRRRRSPPQRRRRGEGGSSLGRRTRGPDSWR